MDTARADRRWLWLYALPFGIAVVALTWAFTHPREICHFGSDNISCGDYSTVKLFVGTVGVGGALLLAGVVGFIARVRTAVNIAAIALGIAVGAIGAIAMVAETI